MPWSHPADSTAAHLTCVAAGIPKLVSVLLGFSTAIKELSQIQLCTLAASAIKEMAKGNRKNQDAIAEAGAIQPLVNMLGSNASQMQAEAAGALANLGRDHSDNQSSIAKIGAIAPLCTLVREGSDETKDASASAIWSLSTDNAANKDTIAKLGGVDPLIGLLVTGNTEKSQICVAGAFAALSAKHQENRNLIAKRLVGLLTASAAKEPARASRVLNTCSSYASDSATSQVAIAKAGGIPPLITWLASMSIIAQAHAAHAVLCLAADNPTTQSLIGKSNGLPPLIALLKKSSPQAQESALRTLWHITTLIENHSLVIESAAIRPLVGMLSTDGEVSPELAAMIMVRLARVNREVSSIIADKGGIPPLVKLLSKGSPGAQQQAAAALAELAMVSQNRDAIANAGGIREIIRLLESPTFGTPETAARALSHLALEDEDGSHPSDDESCSKVDGSSKNDPKARRAATAEALTSKPKPAARERQEASADGKEARGASARRMMIKTFGGVKRLISMLDSSNLAGKQVTMPKSIGLADAKKKPGVDEKETITEALKIGMQEQASAAIADLAHQDAAMQDAVIDTGAVPSLLNFIRSGGQIGQEHAARAIQNLSMQIENQNAIVECGTIPELVQLIKSGSVRAQEVAAAGLSELANGAIKEARAPSSAGPSSAPAARVAKASESLGGRPHAGASAASSAGPTFANTSESERSAHESGAGSIERLVMIAEAGGIPPLVVMLSSSNAQSRENAAGALMHLANEPSNVAGIAKANGLSPLVTILDDGTPRAHEHASHALALLAFENPDNQSQIAKHCVALLGNPSAGAQQRSARALRDMAGSNPGSPVVIVNAGAISPLVSLLSAGALEVKGEAAGALSTLAFMSPSTQLAIATGLVALLGIGTADSQEHVTQLLLTLAQDPENCQAIAKAGAIKGLVTQLRGALDSASRAPGPATHSTTSIKAQELAAAVLSYLSHQSEANVDAISSFSGIRPLVALLNSDSAKAQTSAAAVLSHMAKRSGRNKHTILNEGGIVPLVTLLAKDNYPKAKAEAAGALLALSAGQQEAQKAIVDAGAIKPLVALLSEEHDVARTKAAGAIAALGLGSTANQDAVEKYGAIGKLVGLLNASLSDEVRAEAAAALAVLARGNEKNQNTVTSAGGIAPLVALLQDQSADRAKEEAASALWSLSSEHYENQKAIADAGGIAPIVAVVGLDSIKAQEQAAGALAALALNNDKNETFVAELVVSFLGSDDKQAAAKAARAISHLARAHRSNQVALAKAGGVSLLVSLLNTEDGGVGDGLKSTQESGIALELAKIQREIASAIWSMANNNPENQMAIASAGGIRPLIALLGGVSEVHRDVAGALWSLATNQEANQKAIANSDGIIPLVRCAHPWPPSETEARIACTHT